MKYTSLPVCALLIICYTYVLPTGGVQLSRRRKFVDALHTRRTPEDRPELVRLPGQHHRHRQRSPDIRVHLPGGTLLPEHPVLPAGPAGYHRCVVTVHLATNTGLYLFSS